MSDERKDSGGVKVEDHLGLVRAVVYKFCRKGRLEDSELYSVGCVALVEAARSFDPSRSKFCTWATRLIRQRVLDEVRKSYRERARSSDAGVDNLVDGSARSLAHMIPQILGSSEGDSKADSAGKAVLRRYYLDEMSLSELGRELGISKEGVRKRLNSAISMVRKKNSLLLENMQ